MLGRCLLAAVSIVVAGGPAASAQARVIVDGNARFDVITPSLVRLEYAADGSFEDRRSQTTAGRMPGSARARTSVRHGMRVIQTSRIRLRWRRGSDGFGPGSLSVRIGRRAAYPAPGPNPAPLGGWRRSLDLVDGPVPLHEGMLSRAGWYLLDDSATALADGGWFAPRPERQGKYQDLYLFAYGSDYARGLRDLRKLTGAAPLLPRKAFGVWFSRWWPYSADDWRQVLSRFRSSRIPLDVISLDTDWKRVHDAAGAALASSVVGAPGGNYSWNGWDWNAALYPDPAEFFRWARGEGVEVGLNIHPSISSSDPRFAETQRRAGGGLTVDDGCRVTQADPNGQCMVFDWTDRKQLDAYFALHDPIEKHGAGFWWLDWCCDGTRADAPGLTPDTWINKHYFERQRARGSRWPSFQRIGGSFQEGFGAAVGNGAFAEHRYTLQFTGDTCASWPLLGFASQFTAAAASIGLPYVSHDIGTFHAVSPNGVCDKDLSPLLTPRNNTLPPDMYVRWMQLGTFQPLDRLHSHHGKRMPWEYPEPYARVAEDFLRLRASLVPLTYTLARQARDTGMPIARALYLTWPRQPAAYEHPAQYTFGRDLLVAPVSAPGDPAATEVWFPPGTWIDWFTGERHRGPATRTLSVPLARMPVFVRAGAIVPSQDAGGSVQLQRGPAQPLYLTAQPGNGRTTVYEDAGEGFGYERGRYARTAVVQHRRRGTSAIRISPARGALRLPRRRSYVVRLAGVPRPRSVRVNGRRARVIYDRARRMARVTVVTRTRRGARVVFSR